MQYWDYLRPHDVIQNVEHSQLGIGLSGVTLKPIPKKITCTEPLCEFILTSLYYMDPREIVVSCGSKGEALPITIEFHYSYTL